MSEAKRVLVADDSETVTTLLVTALELEGYEVDTAINGIDAHEKGIAGDGHRARGLGHHHRRLADPGSLRGRETHF